MSFAVRVDLHREENVYIPVIVVGYNDDCPHFCQQKCWCFGYEYCHHLSENNLTAAKKAGKKLANRIGVGCGF